jgi:hypothetical protein
VPVGRLADVMGWPEEPDRAVRVASTVVADGLAELDATGTYRLPDASGDSGARATP